MMAGSASSATAREVVEAEVLLEDEGAEKDVAEAAGAEKTSKVNLRGRESASTQRRSRRYLPSNLGRGRPNSHLDRRGRIRGVDLGTLDGDR